METNANPNIANPTLQLLFENRTSLAYIARLSFDRLCFIQLMGGEATLLSVKRKLLPNEFHDKHNARISQQLLLLING